MLSRVRQVHEGWTPLRAAAQSTRAHLTRLLVEASATVDATDSHGNTPLGTAVFIRGERARSSNCYATTARAQR